MNYVKKMCILRQIKQGFSADGKTLSGLIKIEQYGKNLAVEVSIINFAPLSTGEYYCLLSDGRGKTEMLSLRGKSIFNILSDVDVSEGFCGIVCYVKTEVIPIAYGINGNGSYNWRAILNKTMPPVFPKKDSSDSAISDGNFSSTVSKSEQNADTMYALSAPAFPEPVTPPAEETPSYDDESIATENYYQEKKDERIRNPQNIQNARAESGAQKESEPQGDNATANDDATSVRQPFNANADGYYLSVKRELDDLFSRYPQDRTLSGAFHRSEWVRIRGTTQAPQYLVGAVYEEGRVRYLCYALAAEDRNNPPEEIAEVCTFVPVSPLLNAEGFFVIFQSAATGECLKPPRA